MTIRTFSVDEITEISQYLQTNAQLSKFNQMIIITEEPFSKLEVFLLAYRLLESASRYVKESSTKVKIENILESAKKSYYRLDQLHKISKHNASSFGNHRTRQKIIFAMTEPEIKEAINPLIDAIIVFSEKIQLNNADAVSGLDLEKDFSKTMLKEIRENVD